MDIISLNEQLQLKIYTKRPSITDINEDVKDVKLNQDEGLLYDLFKATISNFIDTIQLGSYIVKPEDEMRIDLILKNMYELENDAIQNYFGNIDIILVINNIDNPLNIKSGQVLFYPPLADFDEFRIRLENDVSTQSRDVIRRLGVPDKTSRVDSSRKKYLSDGVALPPTVNPNPKDGATIKNGQFIVGGI